jgi:hypothetical protein
MAKENRYVVQMDMYVYAENDYMARKRAHRLAGKIDADVTEIGEQPFASMNYRKLEDHSKPSDKSKDAPLPF